MAYTGKSFLLAHEYLYALSQRRVKHFDTGSNEDKPELAFQANTQADVEYIRRTFPGTVWKKSYRESTKWWEYTTRLENGLTVRMYAVYEAPKTCHAVMKTVTVEEKVPVEFETRTVTKEVIDHWVCDDED